MKARRIRLLILLALALYLFGPLFESIDGWDNFDAGTGDIVLTVDAVLAPFVGAFALRIVKRKIAGQRSLYFLFLLPERFLLESHAVFSWTFPAACYSPPVFLRI